MLLSGKCTDVLFWLLFLSLGFWRSRIFEIPGSSNWTGHCVSELLLAVIPYSSPLMLIPSWNVNYALGTICFSLHCFLASSLAAAALRASTTSLQPKTWPAPRSLQAPPPPPPPKPPTSHLRRSSAASGPDTSWSWRTSKTTTTLWTARSENLWRSKKKVTDKVVLPEIKVPMDGNGYCHQIV